MLIVGNDAQAFIWGPPTGATKGWGVTVRYRTGVVWTHLSLTLLQRNPRDGSRTRPGRWRSRRTLTVAELTRWQTRGTGMKNRIGLKQYVRVKVGPGGRQV